VTVEILPVPLPDRALVERFIRVPWFIYREHAPSPHWVPPLLMDRRDFLDPKKNPFFDHADAAFWIARKDGRDVGRIAAVHDRDWEAFHGDRAGSWGMWECPDDAEVSSALFETAWTWLRARNRAHAVGPFDLSTNHMVGLLVDGFDSDPSIQMPYHPPYYARLVEQTGGRKAKDLFQWWLGTDTPIPEKVARVADKVRERNRVSLRPMNLKDWDAEVGRVLSIYNDAWEKNWGFVPVGEKEFRHLAKDLKMVVKEELALMAEVDGEPVAFSITVQDIHPILKKVDGRLFPWGALRLLWDLMLVPKVDRGRLLVLGIKGGYRRRGIDSILFVETHRAASRVGWKGGEIGWTLEDNDMVNRAIGSMGGRKVKTYRVYDKALQEGA
jgi:ribosomal protein S18 acetylase RimI-like enzyme